MGTDWCLIGFEGNEDPEARKAEIEHHKQAQLREQKEGKNEWKEAIASESESIVSVSHPSILFAGL